MENNYANMNPEETNDRNAAPQNGTYQAPQGGTYQAPQSGTYQAPQNGTYQAPQGGTYQAPQSGTYQAPRAGAEEDVYVPAGQTRAESTETYGAVYTPAGGVDGEYHFRPYTKTAVMPEAPASAPAAPAPQQKKRGSAGKIIGITAAVVICIAALAGAVIGVMLIGKKLFPQTPVNERSPLDTTDAAVSQTEPESTVDLSSTVISISDRVESSSSIQTKNVDRSQKLALEEAVELVHESVVEITTEAARSDVFFGRSYITGGAGSGVIISADGKIITNHHVIDGATKITVRLYDGTVLEAKLIASDEEADIAVISVNPGDTDLTVAVLGNSDSLRLGQSIFVIGNPLGELGGSVSAGVISATKREIAVDAYGTMTLIQTDAAVNPGNSGGGLFNLYGELVGIINAKYSDTGVEGLGFAIPVNDGFRVATDLMQHGYVTGRVVHGLKGLTLADRTYQSLFASGTVVVVTAAEGQEDIQVGDYIREVNGVEVDSISELKRVLRSVEAGTKVRVVYQREVRRGSLGTTYSYIAEVEVYEVEQIGPN